MGFSELLVFEATQAFALNFLNCLKIKRQEFVSIHIKKALISATIYIYQRSGLQVVYTKSQMFTHHFSMTIAIK